MARKQRVDTSRYVTTDTEQTILKPKMFQAAGIRFVRTAVNQSFGLIWQEEGAEAARITTQNETMVLCPIGGQSDFYSQTAKNNTLQIGRDRLQFNSHIILHTGNLSQYINSSAIKTTALNEQQQQINDNDMKDNEIKLGGGVDIQLLDLIPDGWRCALTPQEGGQHNGTETKNKHKYRGSIRLQQPSRKCELQNVYDKFHLKECSYKNKLSRVAERIVWNNVLLGVLRRCECRRNVNSVHRWCTDIHTAAVAGRVDGLGEALTARKEVVV